MFQGCHSFVYVYSGVNAKTKVRVDPLLPNCSDPPTPAENYQLTVVQYRLQFFVHVDILYTGYVVNGILNKMDWFHMSTG